VTAARGSLALRRGDVEGAVRLNCAALEVKRALGHRDHVADIQNTLANAYLRQGRRDEALAFARASLRLALELEASWLVIYGFEAFCEIAAGNERFEEAARYCGLAQALRRAHTYWSTNARKMDDIENVLRARLGDRFDAILAGCADADWRRIATELAGAP
jgi:tetratricopeptide (TPR) repeat protein